MSAATWSARRMAHERQLLDAMGRPEDAVVPAALSAIATLIALSASDPAIELVPGRTRPGIRTSIAIDDDPFTLDLLDALRDVVVRALTEYHPAFDPVAWVEQYDLSTFMAEAIAAADGADVLRLVLEHAARAARQAAVIALQLLRDYRVALAARDLPGMGWIANRHSFSDLLRWILTPERDGQPDRLRLVQRRRQAATLFAGLATTLRMPAITSVVDAGVALLPALATALDLPVPHVRAARGIVSIEQENGTCRAEPVLEQLALHEVPLAEWPASGCADKARAWERSAWIGRSPVAWHPPRLLFRPDLMGAQVVLDAYGALVTDLLRPLIAALVLQQTNVIPAMRTLCHLDINAYGLDFSGALPAPDTRRLKVAFLRALRHAVIGPRRAGAIAKAAERWHRRAAAVAALRDERQQERPGWPALCPPWRAGAVEIVPLATARELVEEGTALNHCVGGYYETCRRGDTQILSLRENGRRAATIEITLGEDLRRPLLTVGQFEGLHRCNPTPGHHDALRAFLGALRSGAHPMHLRVLAVFREQRRAQQDRGWSPGEPALPLDHAREAFALHRVLLPRGTPDSYNAWVSDSGLDQAVADLLAQLGAAPVAAPRLQRAA